MCTSRWQNLSPCESMPLCFKLQVTKGDRIIATLQWLFGHMCVAEKKWTEAPLTCRAQHPLWCDMRALPHFPFHHIAIHLKFKHTPFSKCEWHAQEETKRGTCLKLGIQISGNSQPGTRTSARLCTARPPSTLLLVHANEHAHKCSSVTSAVPQKPRWDPSLTPRHPTPNTTSSPPHEAQGHFRFSFLFFFFSFKCKDETTDYCLSMCSVNNHTLTGTFNTQILPLL